MVSTVSKLATQVYIVRLTQSLKQLHCFAKNAINGLIKLYPHIIMAALLFFQWGCGIPISCGLVKVYGKSTQWNEALLKSQLFFTKLISQQGALHCTRNFETCICVHYTTHHLSDTFWDSQ